MTMVGLTISLDLLLFDSTKKMAFNSFEVVASFR